MILDDYIILSQDMINEGFIYRPPSIYEINKNPRLKKAYQLALELGKEKLVL